MIKKLHLLFLLTICLHLCSQAQCTAPVINNAFYGPVPACNGVASTINIAGLLNDATAWHVYTGSCGGTLVGTFTGLSYTVFPTDTTTYYIRGEGGCVTPGACTSLTIDLVTIVPNASITNPISCFGTSDGAILTAPSGGTRPYAYDWSNSSTDSSINGLSANKYIITISDANDCFVKDTIDLIQPNQLTDTNRFSFCDGDSINIDGTWYSSPTTFDNIITTGSCDTVVHNVVSIDSITPALDLGLDTVINCTSGNITLTASNLYSSYNWSTGGANNTETISGGAYGAGNFIVSLTITASNGCSATDSVVAIFENCVNIQEVTTINTFEIYPNPSSRYVTIKSDNNYKSTFTLFGMDGKIALSEIALNKTTTIDLKGIPKGSYIIQLNQNNNSVSKQLIIK